MSGIQSALSASMQDLSAAVPVTASAASGASSADPAAAGLSDELVSEVDSVLSRLMSSSASTPSSAGSQKDWLKDPFGNLPKRPATTADKQDFEPVVSRTFDPRNKTDAEETTDESHVASKIPWKIRAARKRQMKHHTTGLTKDEFAQIQQSLRESAAKCKSRSRSMGWGIDRLIERFLYPPASNVVSPHPVESYALTRNKSEGAMIKKQQQATPTVQPAVGGAAAAPVPSSYQHVEGNRAYRRMQGRRQPNDVQDL